MKPSTLEEAFSVWFRGNGDAVTFAANLWRASQEWDDLEDEGACDHNPLLYWLTFGKERDPYFAAHRSDLLPIWESVYLRWRCANVLDHESEHVDKAYMLRAGLYDLFLHIACLEGGHAWAAEVGPDIYRTYGETLADLRREFDHA